MKEEAFKSRFLDKDAIFQPNLDNMPNLFDKQISSNNSTKSDLSLLYGDDNSFQYINNKKPMLLSMVNSSDIFGNTHTGYFELNCEIGMGYTVAHSLRRVLLSNFFGIAPVALRIKVVNGKTVTYAKHQFDVLPGISENVLEIISNVRKLCITEQSINDEDIKIETMFIEDEKIDGLMLSIMGVSSGPLSVAKAEVRSDRINIVNRNQHICTLDNKVCLYIDICFGYGYGSLLAEHHKFKPHLPEGFICMNANFSPILSVDYQVEEITGEKYSYDKVKIKIETNHSILPLEALQQAAAKIKNNMSVLSGNAEIDMLQQEDNSGELFIYETKITDCSFSIRTKNCLMQNGITKLVDLVTKEPEELLALPGFGDGCLTDVSRILQDMNLQLGIKVQRRKAK